MLNLVRLQGQSVVIETPTGPFHILVKETQQNDDSIVLKLSADWMSANVEVTLRPGGSVAPSAFASGEQIRRSVSHGHILAFLMEPSFWTLTFNR
jgi:hypothetical protein